MHFDTKHECSDTIYFIFSDWKKLKYSFKKKRSITPHKYYNDYLTLNHFSDIGYLNKGVFLFVESVCPLCNFSIN